MSEPKLENPRAETPKNAAGLTTQVNSDGTMGNEGSREEKSARALHALLAAAVPASTLLEALTPFLRSRVSIADVEQSAVRFASGFSGWNFEIAGIAAGSLRLAALPSGGFVVHRTYLEGASAAGTSSGMHADRYDFYSELGLFSQSSEQFLGAIQPVTEANLDPAQPILSHLYGLLSQLYAQAELGQGRRRWMHTTETLVRAAGSPTEPHAWSAFEARILEIESDPVLHWSERRLMYLEIRAERERYARTWCRVHGRSFRRLALRARAEDIRSLAFRVWMRPWNNFKGMLYRYTVGLAIWFFTTVRGNIGYSIALAIYGPFTFYFITQPMNPHAMWAVGRVRSAYLETVEKATHAVGAIFGDTTNGLNSGLNSDLNTDGTTGYSHPNPSGANAILPSGSSGTSGISQGQGQGQAQAQSQSQTQSQTLSPSQTQGQSQNQMQNSASPSGALNNGAIKSGAGTILLPTAATTIGTALSNDVTNKDQWLRTLKPQVLGLLTNADVPDLDHESWSDRMSTFKDMQIGYEESMQFAARIGRIEHMETQLNFPLIAQSTWAEIDRYRALLIEPATVAWTKDRPERAAFVSHELERTDRAQIYIWDRTLRFTFDHPYILMDMAHEQEQADYYVGKGFIALRDMTRELSARIPSLKKPSDYKKIETLAAFYEKSRVEGKDVLSRLQSNSKLFRQKNRYDSLELRSYMRRHWEVLYLLQSKAQEASNFGLQTYTWSVRNAIWIFQSLYSAKREEFRNVRDGKTTALVAAQSVEPLYESLLHMLTLEYVSIRNEIANRLAKDIESVQRRTLIDDLEESMRERPHAFGLS